MRFYSIELLFSFQCVFENGEFFYNCFGTFNIKLNCIWVFVIVRNCIWVFVFLSGYCDPVVFGMDRIRWYLIWVILLGFSGL